jgi:hypothetical protein
MNIGELGQRLVETRGFISDVLGDEEAKNHDVDAIAELLKEGGFDLCPNCVRWRHADEIDEYGDCQECRDVKELYRIGGRL